MKMQKYKLNFVCPNCKEKSNLHIIDRTEMASETGYVTIYKDVPNNHNPHTHTYTEFLHNIGVCNHSMCAIDYDTLERVRIECANCGWVLPESEEREAFFWLKENNYLEEIINGGD